MELKRCSKCREFKTLDNFYRDKTKKSGYGYQCKACIKSNESRKEYLKEYRETHKEYFREKHAEYRERNREKLKEKSKVNYWTNREKISQRAKEYRKTDRCKQLEKARRQTDRYKGYVKYRKAIRRGAERQGDRDITLEKLYIRDKGVCQICGKKCNWRDIKIQGVCSIVGRMYPSIDHIKPISRGGSHTWDNVQLAHFSCNSSKNNKEAI